jgi:hypothetical protein
VRRERPLRWAVGTIPFPVLLLSGSGLGMSLAPLSPNSYHFSCYCFLFWLMIDTTRCDVMADAFRYHTLLLISALSPLLPSDPMLFFFVLLLSFAMTDTSLYCCTHADRLLVFSLIKDSVCTICNLFPLSLSFSQLHIVGHIVTIRKVQHSTLSPPRITLILSRSLLTSQIKLQ